MLVFSHMAEDDFLPAATTMCGHDWRYLHRHRGTREEASYVGANLSC